MPLSEETIIGLRDIKAAAEDCGSVNKVPLTLDLLKVANNSHRMYLDYLRQQNAKERQKKLKNQNKKHTKGNLIK